MMMKGRAWQQTCSQLLGLFHDLGWPGVLLMTDTLQITREADRRSFLLRAHSFEAAESRAYQEARFNGHSS
jgi:hypothetical protein